MVGQACYGSGGYRLLTGAGLGFEHCLGHLGFVVFIVALRQVFFLEFGLVLSLYLQKCSTPIHSSNADRIF